jgi:prepilin-type N-terminal cleavage/methylation domain-containing protein
MSLKSRGFTLIEVLVVLILIALMTYLLMQSMSQVMFLRFRFVQFLETLQVGKVQEQWFRQTASSIITDQPPATDIFKGTEKGFNGRILNPLKGHIGVPTPVSMKLVHAGGRVHLMYSEPGAELELGSWAADKARFSYLDKGGELNNEWPPMSRSPQLTPYGILLQINDVAGPVIWFAAVQQRHTTWVEKLTLGME